MQGKTATVPRRWRTAALIAMGIAIGTTMTATPVYSHVGGTVTHLWTDHIKPKADQRYANAVAGTDKAKDADKVDGKDAAELVGARAYARVQGMTCSAQTNLCHIAKGKGVAYAVDVGDGHYCVGVSGINAADPDSVALVVTQAAHSHADFALSNGACVDSEFEIFTRRENADGTTTLVDATFLIVIP